ncbi:MAG: serine/threonine protein kinase [Deltaproteobacteria bacterium]|nr:serine/threonine protein kinase [Deltaproteobacteria bacterium]
MSAYRIESQLGYGGMGWVFRARHELDGHVVALKVLRDDQLTVERSIDRMMREASILASVEHDGVPRFYECGMLPDGRPWIAMELVEGTSLGEAMQRGAMSADDVIDFIDSVSGVLAAAHDRGVTHRDLKPDNVLLTPSSSYPVRVIDWGIAHHLAGTRYTDINEAIGTPTYMAPEQARGGTPQGTCDVYGLGVVAYQALSGRPPFVGSSAIEILVQHLNRPVPPLAPRCPQVPVGLIELVERMLSKNTETRPTALEVCAATKEMRSSAGRDSSRVSLFIDGVPAILHEQNDATTSLRAPHLDKTGSR